jgi:hypothetical protein
MYSTIEKWQATVIVLASIAALVALAIVTEVDGTLVAGAIGGIPTLVLGAGAVAHGSRLAARSALEAEDRVHAADHRHA